MGVDAHSTIVALVHVDVKLGFHFHAGLVGSKIPQQLLKIIRLLQFFYVCFSRIDHTSL